LKGFHSKEKTLVTPYKERGIGIVDGSFAAINNPIPILVKSVIIVEED